MNPLSDPEAIAANRLGRVTARQREAFVNRPRKIEPRLIIFIIGLLVLSLCILENIWPKFQNPGGPIFILLGLGLMSTSLLIGFVWDAIQTRQTQAEIKEPNPKE